MDQFVTCLRKLAAHCEFADLNKELKAAVILNCQSKRLCRFGLREEDMTLDKLVAKARALKVKLVEWKAHVLSQVGQKVFIVSTNRSDCSRSVQCFSPLNQAAFATTVD